MSPPDPQPSRQLPSHGPAPSGEALAARWSRQWNRRRLGALARHLLAIGRRRALLLPGDPGQRLPPGRLRRPRWPAVPPPDLPGSLAARQDARWPRCLIRVRVHHQRRRGEQGSRRSVWSCLEPSGWRWDQAAAGPPGCARQRPQQVPRRLRVPRNSPPGLRSRAAAGEALLVVEMSRRPGREAAQRSRGGRLPQVARQARTLARRLGNRRDHLPTTVRRDRRG